MIDKKQEILEELLNTDAARKLLAEHGLEPADVQFSVSTNPLPFEALKAVAFAKSTDREGGQLTRFVNQKLELLMQESGQ